MVLPHGNNKKTRAAGYVRTKKSVVEALKEVSAMKKPKQAFHEVDAEKGGILKVTSQETVGKHKTNDAGWLQRKSTLSYSFL